MVTNTCSKITPMPKDRDQMGQHWVHVDAILQTGQRPIKKYGDSALYTCANCKTTFRQIMTEQGLMT